MGDKSQAVRALDVFVLGPFLIFVSLKYRSLPFIVRASLNIIGYVTMVYNARNFVAHDRSNEFVNAIAQLPLIDPFPP